MASVRQALLDALVDRYRVVVMDYAERFIRTIKESCLERIVLIGEGALRRSVREFVEHYHHERNHQGLGNRLICPPETPGRPAGPIYCRPRLGGLLNYYYRAAA